ISQSLLSFLFSLHRDLPVLHSFPTRRSSDLYLFLGVGKAKEPVGVETFLPEASVERLDECVVGGLAGPGEVQRDAALVGPDVEIARHELGALIDTDRKSVV